MSKKIYFRERRREFATSPGNPTAREAANELDKQKKSNVGTAQFKASGFTLLEILIVIALIGLLFSIILVATQSVRKRANRARILQQTQEIRKTAELYLADSQQSFYPPHESLSVGQLVIPVLQCKDPGGQYKWVNFGTYYGGANGVNGACVGVGYWNTIGWQKTLLFVGEYDGANPNGCIDNPNTMKDAGTFADYVANRCY